MFGLSQIQLVIIGGLLGLVLTAGGIAYVFDCGRDTGAADVTKAVQDKTIEALDAARISKERTDEEVRCTPYDDRADGLR